MSECSVSGQWADLPYIVCCAQLGITFNSEAVIPFPITAELDRKQSCRGKMLDGKSVVVVVGGFYLLGQTNVPDLS